MQLSTILSLYIGRNFLISFAVVFVSFLGIVYMFDTVELLRRASSTPDIELGLVFQMGFLRLPFLAQKLFPFAVLFGGMVAFWRMTRSKELVVTRAGVTEFDLSSR